MDVDTAVDRRNPVTGEGTVFLSPVARSANRAEDRHLAVWCTTSAAYLRANGALTLTRVIILAVVVTAVPSGCRLCGAAIVEVMVCFV
jgi:hypothetical protein